jgi:hypothetical protein
MGPEKQYIRVNVQFFIGDPLRRECHSTQNLILHLTQVESGVTQVKQRIAVRNTPRMGPRKQYIRVKVQFLIGDPLRRECHSTQNLILHLTQVKSGVTQVKQRIARETVEYRANFTYVSSTYIESMH